MQYFDSRSQAGDLLADKLENLRTEGSAVIALSPGGILVGAEIAKRIHCGLFVFLVTADVMLPGETDPLATMSTAGTFTFNSALSEGQIEEYVADYRSVIDQERIENFHKLNRIAGKDGFINRDRLKNHTLILVGDGFKDGTILDVASDFLKPVMAKKIIVAAPLASVPAVDRMHLLADEIQCLGVVNNYLDTDHYYLDNKVPGQKEAMSIIKNISLDWE